jgi:stringent starvation protein B
MQSTKPYLIRAIHEWCADQGFTPYLAVAVDGTTKVPREFVKDGEIVLNVGYDATHQLSMGNDEITFQARFGGRPFPVIVPIGRVQAIYARENGQGMAFEVEDSVAVEADDESREPAACGDLQLVASESEEDSPDDKPPAGRPFLTRVK